MPELELTVSEFIAVFNQTLEYAYPSLIVSGELANFRISKNKWVYFDLKDKESIVRCFGSVYQLPGPMEDGMLLKVKASPRLHPQYGFSLNFQQIQLSGEGTIKKASDLLSMKLKSEGLFDLARKRSIPYPPHSLGLITSIESAAYSDFIKVLSERWGGIEVTMIDVQVQGQLAPEQIVQAVEAFNQTSNPPEVLIIIRGGGSADDLQAYSTEQVVRAVAASRIPTLVAIGHERDISLAELAADQRASTPSNAAELLVPDRTHIIHELDRTKEQFNRIIGDFITRAADNLKVYSLSITESVERVLERAHSDFKNRQQLLELLSPQMALNRGYAIIRKGKKAITSAIYMSIGDIVTIQMIDGYVETKVTNKLKVVNNAK